MFMHTFFGFDVYFLRKGLRATAWNSIYKNIGGTNLTHINFVNIGGETKFIDGLKYYQNNLGQLATTISEEKKFALKKAVEQFLTSNDHCSET